MGTLGYLFALAESTPPGLTSTEADYWPVVESEAAAFGLDPALIMAVIRVESSFRPMATHTDRDGKKSYGLMQLRLATARQVAGDPRLQPEALFDPAIGIHLGAAYLRRQLSRYGGNVLDAVAAYNAGSVFRRPDGSYANQEYVDKLVAAYDAYRILVVPEDGYTDLETRRATRQVLDSLPSNGLVTGNWAPWAIGIGLLAAVGLVFTSKRGLGG